MEDGRAEVCGEGSGGVDRWWRVEVCGIVVEGEVHVWDGGGSEWRRGMWREEVPCEGEVYIEGIGGEGVEVGGIEMTN